MQSIYRWQDQQADHTTGDTTTHTVMDEEADLGAKRQDTHAACRQTAIDKADLAVRSMNYELGASIQQLSNSLALNVVR